MAFVGSGLDGLGFDTPLGGRRDRLSVHIENREDHIREAVTILRHGGTTAQPGLVGITNTTYDAGNECLDIALPETIFNVQSSGDCDVRFSSRQKAHKSSLELLGNGNARASGLHISYNPLLDEATVQVGISGEICVDPSNLNSSIVDFSLIRPSGTQGIEFGHISLSENGYVGIGVTRVANDRKFNPNAPLTVSYSCDLSSDSGTVSLRAQSISPSADVNFGKLFVKPYEVGLRSHALFFVDGSGTETNLVLSQDIDPLTSTDGLIYGDNGNTYGGHYSPSTRAATASLAYNTTYGWGAGYNLIASNSFTSLCNTLIGHHAGSGLITGGGNSNTVIGCNNLVGYTNASNNIIIGEGILSQGNGFGGIDDCILIGRDLYNGALPLDGQLVIGFGSEPIVFGQLVGASKFFSIADANFSVLSRGKSEFVINIESDPGLSRHTTIFDTIDDNKYGLNPGENNLKFNFSNNDDLSITLFELDPRGGPLSNTPTYQAPGVTTPFARLEADFKLGGAIRFQDGTSMSGLSYFNLLPITGTSGVNSVFNGPNNTNYFVLDFSSLELAGNLSNNIRTDNTYLAVQVDGTASTKTGKISLQGLADYIGSGTSSIAENCNILISNAENQLLVNTAANSSTVMIGCDVATAATGWKHSVMIGTQAGANATTPNGGLSVDTASVFIGYRAGYNCDNVDNTICIGTNAGKNALSSSDSVYIGSNAGLDSPYDESIGIGENALRGSAAAPTGIIGIGNLEIVCGILDNQRLMYQSDALSNRFNIQNTIAGRSDHRNVSIGDARLTPTAPLEVRRDSIIHGSNPNDYIQAWYCNDTLVASIDCDGVFAGGTSTAFIEGILDGPLSVATSINNPTTAVLSQYVNGVDTGTDVTITNRDANLSAPGGTYIIAIKIGGEHRPVWVSC